MPASAPFGGFQILEPYNPWWQDPKGAFAGLPEFRRDVFHDLYADVRQLPQMVSVTGPRRVGKSTLLLQCIQQLIRDADDPAGQARRIAYFSLDDPALDLPGADRDRFFNDLVQAARAASREGAAFLFLDEVQRFPRWELYLKKFYDLKTPVRFVVSGSASTPIFRKSRESLLGRIKDFHVLPFSFREWFYYRVVARRPGVSLKQVMAGMEGMRELGRSLQMSDLDGYSFCRWLHGNFFGGESHLQETENFLFEGGFPEVWELPSLVARQEYLYQNQVERVIFEDLLVAAEFRKPEMLRRFYLALLKDPGRETNLSQLSGEIELARTTIEGYFPLLEATDLVWRLDKHTSTKATPKAGNFKTYLVDLAVRNAVMKLSLPQMLQDAPLLGAYAENVVANHLRQWPGLVELGYWRRNNDEIDFIVDLGARRIGVEVKYRNQVLHKDVHKAARLAAQLHCECCVIVGKAWFSDEEFERLNEQTPVPVVMVPLGEFLGRF
jgi:predicted AAA+ superfamily ATPase